MSEPEVDSVHQRAAETLQSRAADMFVEVQRADSKATVLCGVAGGLLAVCVTALSRVAEVLQLTVTLTVAAGIIGLALGAALWAIRPVLPRHRTFSGLAGMHPNGDAEDVLRALQVMSWEEQLHLEAGRLSALAGLARRKFQAIKVAVDLTTTALLVAGFGLLFTYITH